MTAALDIGPPESLAICPQLCGILPNESSRQQLYSAKYWVAPFANTRSPAPPVDFVDPLTTGSRMLTALHGCFRSIGLICRGRRAVALENLALRQQLATLTRTIKRPELRMRDRLRWDPPLQR